MKEIYSDERRNRIASLNKNKSLSDSVLPAREARGLYEGPSRAGPQVRNLIREKALNRSEEVKNKYRLASSKPVTLYSIDGSVYMKFGDIRLMAKHFGCDHKTINKYIKSGELFKRLWYVKLD